MANSRGRASAGAASAVQPSFADVLAGRWRGFGPALSDAIWPWFRACLAHEAEQRRLFPWLAVAFGAGIALAFAADGPLSPWAPLVGAVSAAGAALVVRGRPVPLAVALALVMACLGFLAAVMRMAVVEAPILTRMTIGSVSGFVESLEERGSGGRLVLVSPKLDRVAAESWPARIRVSARSLAGIKPGDYVRGTMRLLPLPEASSPGGYDFARDAYFRGIGAVGSVSGRLVTIDPPAAPSLSLRIAAGIDRARNALTARIAETIGGQAGAVAAALITGKRGLIDEHTNDVLRAAGIYHVVSISGLHMVLAAGTFFWLTRALLALSPALALAWPIKKIAAVAGMLGATAYCVFSGLDVAAERSLLMILVMQGAILFDRPALSLRNLALSAIIVLAREPEALLGPSLQMSYGAVAAMIALAEWHRGRTRPPREDGFFGRALLWARGAILGAVATTLIASLATGPFGTYHFHNLQPYGMLGNAVTLPLISLAVMPAAVIGVLAFPFGLDRPVWTLMGWAVAAVLELSRWVAGMAGSVVIVPAFGLGTLGLFVAALLCATLFASALRWLALAPALLAFWAAGQTPRPDIYLARDGSGAAIRGRDGRLVIAGRVSAFTAEQWLRADGDARKAAEAASGQAGSERARCDRMGCIVPMRDGATASFVEDRRGFAEDCRRATIILSRLAAPPGCAASLVLDRAALAERGAMAIRFGPSGPVIEGTRRTHETRPWLVRGEPDRVPPARHPVTPAQRSSPLPDPNEPARDPLDDAPNLPLDAQ